MVVTSLKEGPIGTGPYVVKSFTKERAEMAANEKYWDGAVPFKTVEIPSIDDPNTRALSFAIWRRRYGR